MTSAEASARDHAIVPAGARYMLASAFFFSIMSLLVKLAGRWLPSQEIVLARGVVTLILSYWMVKQAGLYPWGNRRWILILRGLFGFAALSCFYYALTQLPIAEATVLHYTNPVWTALLAAVFLRERLNIWVVGPIAVSFAGVLMITRPAALFAGAAATINPVGVGVALLGAAMSGAAYVTVREAVKTEHPLVIVFFFPLVAVPATLPFISGFRWPSGLAWLVLIGVGVSTQIAQVYLTRGLSLIPAARAITIGYSQIIFVAIWGMLFFGEYLDGWSVVGSLLIIGGTLAVGLRRRTAMPGAAHTERAGYAESVSVEASRSAAD